MSTRTIELGRRFLVEEAGQGITEYGAILAFVAVLIGVLFTATSGTLKQAISNSFSAVQSQLNAMNAAS